MKFKALFLAALLAVLPALLWPITKDDLVGSWMDAEGAKYEISIRSLADVGYFFAYGVDVIKTSWGSTEYFIFQVIDKDILFIQPAKYANFCGDYVLAEKDSGTICKVISFETNTIILKALVKVRDNRSPFAYHADATILDDPDFDELVLTRE